MKKVLNLYKKIGETPLEAIKRFKEINPEYQESKMTYAGRLDPLAEGILLVLVDEEISRKEDYLNLTKEYEIEILWGVVTDTLDPLGLIKKAEKTFPPSQESLIKILKNFKNYEQKYPDFSSKTVGGMPMWVARRVGKHVKEVKHVVKILNFEVKETAIWPARKIADDAIKRIYTVKGDFRQKESVGDWLEFRSEFDQDEFYLTKIKIECTPGTYMRQLAYDLALECNLPGAIAFRILRTKVGEYGIEK